MAASVEVSRRLALTDIRLHRRRWPCRFAVRELWLALCLIGLTQSAIAQEDPTVLAARALFDQARQLVSQGKHEAACKKFEESQRLRSGIGTQFNLASCYEETGRIASAWSLYRRVAAETRSLGQTERERVASDHAQALEPRLSRLTLKVAAPVEGLVVRLDDAEMDPATWGIATPIDPGEHAVTASASGYATWQGQASIPESATNVTLDIPALDPAALSDTDVQLASATPPPTQVEESSASLGVPGIAAIAGATSLAVSGILGLSFMSKNGEAKEICASPASQFACPAEDIARRDQLVDEARRARNAGYALLGIGVVALGVSGVWMLSRGEETETAALELRAAASTDGLRVGLSARF